MSEMTSIEQQIKKLRAKIQALVQTALTLAKVDQLPGLPASLLESQREMARDEYLILVAGEAKRGKSSFINALIGQPILPTNVDIATSQVFRVQHAEQEAYRLRFDDGSTKSISREELPRYGSQVVVDEEGEADVSRFLHWIEVDIPLHFLAPGISLLDTPGLGSLYPGHALITHSFVSRANAVIFVLDSVQPIIQEEIDFLDTLLKTTPYVFFIQTKIDTQLIEEWEQLLRRNQDILHQQFGERLADVRIWPISSQNLLKAIKPEGEDNETFIKISRYRALMHALQNFLFQSTGWDQACKALQRVQEYQELAQKLLEQRLVSLLESNELFIKKQLEQRKRQFTEEWGAYGVRHKQLYRQMQAILEEQKEAFLLHLRPECPAEMSAHQKVHALRNLDEANAYSNLLSEQLNTYFLERWRQTGQSVHKRCLALFDPFLQATEKLSIIEDTRSNEVLEIEHNRQLTRSDFSPFVEEQLRQETEILASVGRFASQSYQRARYAREFDERSLSDTFVEDLIHLAKGLYTFLRGRFLLRSLQLTDAQQQLHQRIEETMAAIREQFLTPGSNQQNRVERFFSATEENLTEQIQQIVARKADEMQQEIEHLSAQGRLAVQQRLTEQAHVRKQLEEWKQLAEEIGTAQGQLSAVANDFSKKGL